MERGGWQTAPVESEAWSSGGGLCSVQRPRPGDAATARLADSRRLLCFPCCFLPLLYRCLLMNLFLASLERVRTALRHAPPYFKRCNASHRL